MQLRAVSHKFCMTNYAAALILCNLDVFSYYVFLHIVRNAFRNNEGIIVLIEKKKKNHNQQMSRVKYKQGTQKYLLHIQPLYQGLPKSWVIFLRLTAFASPFCLPTCFFNQDYFRESTTSCSR